MIVGIWFFGETMGTVRLLLLLGLIGCIIGLKLVAH